MITTLFPAPLHHSSAPAPDPVLRGDPQPPRWWPLAQPGVRLENLDHDQCLALLDSPGDGLLSYREGLRPQRLALGYRREGATLLLGPVPEPVVTALVPGQLALFETDHVDVAAGLGWSIAAAAPVQRDARAGRGAGSSWLHLGLTALQGRMVAAPTRSLRQRQRGPDPITLSA